MIFNHHMKSILRPGLRLGPRRKCNLNCVAAFDCRRIDDAQQPFVTGNFAQFELFFVVGNNRDSGDFVAAWFQQAGV